MWWLIIIGCIVAIFISIIEENEGIFLASIILLISALICEFGFDLYNAPLDDVPNEEYKQIYSHEIKQLSSTKQKSKKDEIIFLLVYIKHTEKEKVEEYYVIWEKTELGYQEKKYAKGSVYFIEDNNETPRIEKWCTSIRCYNQIYIPENTIKLKYDVSQGE